MLGSIASSVLKVLQQWQNNNNNGITYKIALNFAFSTQKCTRVAVML